MSELTDFELPNVTVGPDPFRLLEYAADPDRTAIVLLFLRDYHCPKCRNQVDTIWRARQPPRHDRSDA